MTVFRKRRPLLALLFAYVLILQAFAITAAQARLLHRQLDATGDRAVMALCLPGMERVGDASAEGGVHAPCCVLCEQMRLAVPAPQPVIADLPPPVHRDVVHPPRQTLPPSQGPPLVLGARGPPISR